MKILWLSTSTNNTTTVVDSLLYLNQHQVVVFHYDRLWHEQCAQAIAQNPTVRELLQAGQFHLPRERVGMDDQMIATARDMAPDLILYTSAWEGDFVPLNSTLCALNEIAPTVHFCYDGSDPPWWPQMQQFEKDGCFRLTVNIDGGHVWPGGKDWRYDRWNTGPIQAASPLPPIKNGLTLLTPLDPRAFDGVQVPFNVRPFSVGYAGNAGGWIRNALVQRLQHELKGLFAFKQRDDNLGSYNHYCTFLRHCRVSISVPFTGSNATYHVKGRVLESGYAGACLLEWKNDATRAWFTPRFDFEEYESVEECCEMAQWLSGHPRRCEEIATNLHRRVTTEHSPKAFWSAVFSKLGLPV